MDLALGKNELDSKIKKQIDQVNEYLISMNICNPREKFVAAFCEISQPLDWSSGIPRLKKYQIKLFND